MSPRLSAYLSPKVGSDQRWLFARTLPLFYSTSDAARGRTLKSTDRIAALPCWNGAIDMEPLTGGLSNESWLVRDTAGKHVVRLGKDYPFHHVFREREISIARAAHAAGFAPAVQYAETGIMVSAFVDAKTWTEEDMRMQPERVARLLYDFHHMMPPKISGPGFVFWVFHVIRDYARTLETGRSSHKENLQEYLKLAAHLESVQVPLPIVFGHNDLLPANFLDDGKRLWLIDYEYAGFNTAMFDLAGVASNSNMDDAKSEQLLATYFDRSVDRSTKRAFDAMKCASLLREAMWAMVSELHLNAPGVDYGEYAKENLTRLASELENYHSRYGKIPT